MQRFKGNPILTAADLPANTGYFILNPGAVKFNGEYLLLVDVFHGITKRMLPLYYGEYEWRFNHRHTKDMLSKIKKYVRHSGVHTRKMITRWLDDYAAQRGLKTA